ncbi:MAG: oxidoreductase [Chitinophagaceae bacterium]
MAEKIKTGLIGFGAAAKIMHAPFLATNKKYQLIAVLERNAQESKKIFPDAIVVKNLDDFLQTDIDLAIITTPNDTHFSYAMRALQAGKNVVLEKPFTITSNEALQLIDAAQKTNKVLSVFQNRRYVADFLTIKEILAKNLLGDVHEFEGHFDRYRPDPKPGNVWREQPNAGSGILYDLGAHLIDQALCLFGLPKTINADIRMQRAFAKTDDYFDIELNYGFLKVILKASMLVREPSPRYMIQGTKGSFIKYGEDVQEEKLKAGELPVSANWGEEDKEFYGLLHTEINGEIIKIKYPSQKGNFGLYYENLYDTIVNKKPLKEKPEHGYNIIKLIELAFESNQKKCTVNCKGLINADY